jgi:hypothetical protein
MNRYKAAGLHLLFSAVTLSLVFLLIAQLWYPHKLFSLAAGAELLHLIIGVDLVMGPLVMLIIFDAKKKLIKMDVAIILICQIGFMAYGLWTMYTARPAFLVFAESHFYLVRANEIERTQFDLAPPQYQNAPTLGPVYVGTQMPTDKKSQDEILMGFLGGMGIQDLPRYFVPYDQVRQQVVKAGLTSAKLGVDAETKQRVKDYELEHTEQPVLFLPMVNKLRPLIVVFDARTGDVVDLI